MILKGSQRGGGAQLAAHLLKPENEHVELHDVRGFMADDVRGAFKEAQAAALGTRCKQYLFSLSLNPPTDRNVSVEAFESAIERIEERTGLGGQPRVIIFHEKEGRRHAHCVWSRIDAETMTAKPLSFFKTKLREVSKELYLEHGWQMPRGLSDSQERDPRSFNLAEWQQAKRAGRDPAALKAAVQECWAASDSGKAFSAALEARGLFLARGDRRGHVAITYEGEVLSLARLAGKPTKEVAAKLGDPALARSVAETRTHIATIVAPRLEALLAQADQGHAARMVPLMARRMAMRDRHKVERQTLGEEIRLRAAAEARARSGRIRTGVAGLWDRLSGRRTAMLRQNEAEALRGAKRDRDQRGALVVDQLSERRVLQRDIVGTRRAHAAQVMELHRDIVAQREGSDQAPGLRSSFNAASKGLRRTERSQNSRQRDASRGGRDRGPDIGR